MAHTTPNRQYNVAAPDSLAVLIATWQRRNMYGRFVEDCKITSSDSILDLGVTSDRSYVSSNYLGAGTLIRRKSPPQASTTPLS